MSSAIPTQCPLVDINCHQSNQNILSKNHILLKFFVPKILWLWVRIWNTIALCYLILQLLFNSQDVKHSRCLIRLDVKQASFLLFISQLNF